jgi:hypothetical protein
MPKASPPSILLKFQGRCDWPIEQEVDDWGLNAAQQVSERLGCSVHLFPARCVQVRPDFSPVLGALQESYVEQFRRILAAKNAWKEDQHGNCSEISRDPASDCRVLLVKSLGCFLSCTCS